MSVDPIQAQGSLPSIKEEEKEPKKFSVLVVDDQTYNVFVMKELLSNIPVVGDVQSALNGLEALEQVKEYRPKKFDIILLDLHMPVMDGEETIKELREMHKNNEIDLSVTKVIALSAISDQQFREHHPENLLFDRFMEKPINFQDLKDLFQQI
jgi:CheY-like chemotaxis protein